MRLMAVLHGNGDRNKEVCIRADRLEKGEEEFSNFLYAYDGDKLVACFDSGCVMLTYLSEDNKR